MFLHSAADKSVRGRVRLAAQVEIGSDGKLTSLRVNDGTKLTLYDGKLTREQ